MPHGVGGRGGGGGGDVRWCGTGHGDDRTFFYGSKRLESPRIQVMMLADVCIPEGIVAAGVGEMVISLLFGGSSSSSPSPPPMNAQQLVDAVELGTLSTTCTLMSNSVQDVGSPVVGAQNTEFDPRIVRSIWKNHIFVLGYSRLVGDLKHCLSGHC